MLLLPSLLCLSFAVDVMKCFLFIFTICSMGRFINLKSHDETLPKESSNELDILLEDYPEGPGQSSDEDTPSDSEGNDQNNSGSTFSAYSSSSEDTASGQNKKQPNGKLSGKTVDLTPKDTDSTQRQRAKKLFESAMKAGDTADLIGENQHIVQSDTYMDLGRRFVPQNLKNVAAENDDHLIPEKAPPELVLLVAKESALLRAGRDTDLGNDFDEKKILRTGDYWNGVWKEEVKPKSGLRSATQKKSLGSIKAKIKQGTELYEVVSKMKEISPKLLYIINKKQL